MQKTITNLCTCSSYDEDKGDFVEAPECWGDCWDMTVEDFENDLEPLFSKLETNLWEVNGFPTWHGSMSGVLEAHNAFLLLGMITPNSEWTLRYEVKDDYLDCVLSHHDAPTGGHMTVRPIIVPDEVESAQ